MDGDPSFKDKRPEGDASNTEVYLAALRELKGQANTDGIAALVGVSVEEARIILTVLAENECILAPNPDSKSDTWTLSIRNHEELARLQALHNPGQEPTGHFTGRCTDCHSSDLWTDYTAYGCNCCGSFFFTGDMAPRVIDNVTGADLGQAW